MSWQDFPPLLESQCTKSDAKEKVKREENRVLSFRMELNEDISANIEHRTSYYRILFYSYTPSLPYLWP
jgi:hypothetical protein